MQEGETGLHFLIALLLLSILILTHNAYIITYYA
jgi:hypothetical protein